ncbi:MAG: hypothetical protein ACK55Z_31870, partial [bacterium]
MWHGRTQTSVVAAGELQRFSTASQLPSNLANRPTDVTNRQLSLRCLMFAIRGRILSGFGGWDFGFGSGQRERERACVCL